MTKYEYRAKGKALGATIIVIAHSGATARKLAKEWVVRKGLDPKTLQLVNRETVIVPSVLFAWDGDY